MNALTAMKQTVEAVHCLSQTTVDAMSGREFNELSEAIANLRTAITELEQGEPIYQIWMRYEYPPFWEDVPIDQYEMTPDEDKRILYIHPQDRDSIIEECAKLCDRFGEREKHPYDCADAIRSLKGKK